MGKEKILKDSLSDACQASYVPAIEKGREKILLLPKEWVIKNIHSIATEILDLSDEWEYSVITSYSIHYTKLYDGSP